MKALAGLALLCATFAIADTANSATDRAAIEKVINSLKIAMPVSALFTVDAENELNRLAAVDHRMADAAKEVWSEMTVPVLLIQSVRFVTPDVALVDAANTQFGSTTLTRRVPVLFVMKKVGADWKIASLRVLTASNVL
jgi:hypothetical protein